MSIKVMTDVWDHAPVDGTELLMLLALADMANDDRECWPSVKRLAHKVRVSDRQAQRVIRDLEKRSLISVYINKGRGRAGQHTNMYRVNAMTPVAHDTPVMDVTSTPVMDVTSTPVMDVTLNHHVEPSVEPSTYAPDGAWAGYWRMMTLKALLFAGVQYLDAQRDLVFEAVCKHLFEIEHTDISDPDTRGRINGVSATIRANFETQYAAHFGEGWTHRLALQCARSVEAFVKQWKRQKPDTALPLARQKVGTEYLKFVQSYSAPRPAPPAQPPVPEATPEQRAEMAAARQAIRPQWEQS